MNLHRIVITSFLIITSNLIFAQSSAILKYKLIPKEEFLKIKNPNSETEVRIKNDFKNVYDLLKNINYYLKFNSNESIGYVDDQLVNDFTKQSSNYRVAKILIGDGIYYQNNVLNKKLWSTELSYTKYIVEDSLKVNWKITNDQKKIGNYTALKAIPNYCEVCDKSLKEVWFTPEIPVPFGPDGLGGLPGLILEVVHHADILLVESIRFTDKDISIEKPTKGKLISRLEYENLITKIRANTQKW